jgi:hypothetical protein
MLTLPRGIERRVNGDTCGTSRWSAGCCRAAEQVLQPGVGEREPLERLPPFSLQPQIRGLHPTWQSDSNWSPGKAPAPTRDQSAAAAPKV